MSRYCIDRTWLFSTSTSKKILVFPTRRISAMEWRTLFVSHYSKGAFPIVPFLQVIHFSDFRWSFDGRTSRARTRHQLCQFRRDSLFHLCLSSLTSIAAISTRWRWSEKSYGILSHSSKRICRVCRRVCRPIASFKFKNQSKESLKLPEMIQHSEYTPFKRHYCFP